MTSTEQKLGLSDDAAGLPHREEEQMGAGTQSQAWPGRELLPRGTDRPERDWVCLSEETDYRRYLP